MWFTDFEYLTPEQWFWYEPGSDSLPILEGVRGFVEMEEVETASGEDALQVWKYFLFSLRRYTYSQKFSPREWSCYWILGVETPDI